MRCPTASRMAESCSGARVCDGAGAADERKREHAFAGSRGQQESGELSTKSTLGRWFCQRHPVLCLPLLLFRCYTPAARLSCARISSAQHRDTAAH